MASKLQYLKPRWLAFHLLVAIVASILASLGVWQLNRLDERREQNKLFEARQQQVLSIQELEQKARATNSTSRDERQDIGQDSSQDLGEDLEFYKVELTGKFIPELEATIRNRTMMGRPGVWLLTPFESEGRHFIVNRGWVPRELSGLECRDEESVFSPPDLSAPIDQITITGIIRKASGDITNPKEWEQCLARPELSGFASEASLKLVPNLNYFIQLQTISVEAQNSPNILDPPDRGDGPHLSYAVQWFIFATLVLTIYPTMLTVNYRKKNKISSKLN